MEKLFKRVLSALKEDEGVEYNKILGILTSNEGKFLNEKEIQNLINALVLEKKIKKVGNKFYPVKQSNFFQS